MFKGLKNRIREETGSDVSKINPVLSGGPQKSGVFKGRHSRQGSTSSVGSSSLDGVREDLSVSPIPLDVSERVEDDYKIEKKSAEKSDEEWKKKLNKLESEWKKRLENKEKEWKNQLITKEKENEELERSKLKLEETLIQTEELKQKYYLFQEEKEQIEGFQSQEMAKVKHLLLAKEQEVSDLQSLLKESNTQIASLRLEVNRLRRFEEEVGNVQDEMESLRHSSEQEQSVLRSELAQNEEIVRHLKDRVVVLERRTSADCVALGAPLTVDERVQGLLGERTLLERRLEEAHLHLADIKSSWSSKITSLETQVGRLCRQAAEEKAERRRAEEECLRLQEQVQELQVKSESTAEMLSERDKLFQKCEQLSNDLGEALQGKEDAYKQLTDTQVLVEEKIRQLSEDLESERSNSCLYKESSDVELKRIKAELSEAQKNSSMQCECLHLQIEELRLQLEAERVKCAEMLVALDRERCERDSILMRNAEVSLQVELSKQQLRAQETEMADLQGRVEILERAVSMKEEELENERKLQSTSTCREQELRESVTELETQLLEKNRNIKQLQQRLGDMKKTLQKELKLPPGGFSSESTIGSGPSSDDTTAAVLTPSSSQQMCQRRLHQHIESPSQSDYNSVNFQYLKHVLIKFLTSREYEAKHMTRAVATLLHFSPEEEQLLHETLDWKMSWFGSRPLLGFGQTSKTIPPS